MSRLQLLTDDQWDLIADHLPAPTGRPGRPFSDPRQMVEGIIYRYRTGIAWRDLPETFGKWQTVWTWHRRLATDGTRDTIHAALTAHAAKNDKVDFTVSVDPTIVRSHRHTTNISRAKRVSSNYKDLLAESPDDAFGRSRGG